MHCLSPRSAVWLRCVVSLAVILGIAECHESDYIYDGSGSGQQIPLFPTETVVGFERSQVFAREGGKTVELCAVVYEPFVGDLPQSFTVVIFTEDGRARSGQDYRAITEVLGPFNNTVRRLCAEVELIDDMFCESNPYPEDFSAVMVTSFVNVTVTPRRIGVVVNDQDEPECTNVCVGFEQSVYNTIEEIGYILVCVEVTCPDHLEREVYVTLTTSGFTAKAGRDFVELKGARVGPLGPYSMRRCVAVQIIDDGDCEMLERFYLSLDSYEPLVSFSNNNVQVVIDGTTEYDDCASVRVGFIYNFYSVRESDDNVTLCVGAFEPQRFGARFNLTASTKDGTAAGGIDYIPLDDVIVGPFDQGSRQHCFTVELINDNICGDDPGRSFLIELSSYADRVDLNPVATRVAIYDAVECIFVRVGLAITTFTVQEDELVATTCATVFSPPVLAREVQVTVDTSDGSAEEGEDYIGLTDLQLTFTEMSRTVCFNTTIMNDADCEELEYFSISLTASTQRLLVRPSTGYIIIRDPPLCTAVQVSLERQSYTTYEGAGEVEVCVRIEEEGFPMTQPFTLLVSTQDGSAKAPSDYTALTDEVIGPFNADISEVCFTIPIVQDRVCEGEVDSEGVPAVEVFSAVVRSEVGSDVEVIGAGRIASISIEDSAECIPVMMGFEQSSYSVREAEGEVELSVNITSPAVVRRTVMLTVETSSITATAAGDYAALSQSLGPFSNDQRRLSITVMIFEDGVCDDSPIETLTVRLTSSDPNITLTPATATVNILDSPQCTPGTVTFEQASFISSEETGWAVVCASFPTSPPTSPFTLTFSTYDITANAGEDYVSVSQDLTFGPDSSQQCVLILLTQDSVCEGSMTETFGVRLSSTETSSNTAVQDSASVVIYDASECITVSVRFEEVVYSLPESQGSVQVCAEIVSPAVAERVYFLLLSSVDRDAVTGEDYTGLQEEPLGPFSLSQRRACLTVTVTDDMVCEEPEESFTLSLTTEEDYIEISRGSVTVYIEDVLEIECSQVTLGFETTPHAVQETVSGVEACVSVQASQVLRFAINLTLLTVDGTAIGGLDFNPVDRLLTFSPDQPRHCVTITIINDEECEDRPNEVFSVVIRGDDPRARLRPSSVTVTIDDAGLYGTTVADPDCFPLEIYFTGNTPRVTLESIEIIVNTRGRSLPQTISCDLINNRGDLVQTIDCTGGSALFTDIRRRGFYTVRATVLTALESTRTERRVRYDRSPTACSAHLINRGLTLASGGRASAEFVTIGPLDSFRCTLNGEELPGLCRSPLQLTGLEDSRYGQRYILRVIPVGVACTIVKKLREDFLYSEPYTGS